ncbi:MAG: alpha/beta hydrolase [Pigmentiphaga sp.]|nr:alpha/beta hydrolase [Pigmentiphaga sp.]
MSDPQSVLQRARQRLAAQPAMSEAGEAYSAECLAGHAAAVAATRARLDLAYGPHPDQRLDVFLPPQGSGPWPTVVFWHGGGWTNGGKEWCSFMAPALAAAGVALVAPSYRLLPDVPYPEPMRDAAAAVRWLRDHGGEVGLSPEGWILAGHSAGGQIAALLAVEPRWLREAGVPLERIAGCYAVSATFNRRNLNPAVGEAHLQPGAPEAVQPDSPLALAEQAFTDYLLVWGTAEHARVDVTGRAMAERLAAAERPVATAIEPGGTHFSMHLDHGDPDSSLSRRFRTWRQELWRR